MISKDIRKNIKWEKYFKDMLMKRIRRNTVVGIWYVVKTLRDMMMMTKTFTLLVFHFFVEKNKKNVSLALSLSAKLSFPSDVNLAKNVSE